MKILVSAFLFIASTAIAADVPFYIRALNSDRDISGINENFRSIVNDMVKLRADIDNSETTNTNGANCAAGTFPLGVDANGVAEDCSSTLTGSASLNVLKAGDTMTGQLNVSSSIFVTGKSTFTSLTYFPSGISVSTGLFTYRVGIGTTAPTHALSVIGNSYFNDEILFQGSGAYGRITSSPLGAPEANIKLSWNGHSVAGRDDPAIVGGYYRLASGAIHTWGNEDYVSADLRPGSDSQGHLVVGFGNSGAYTHATQTNNSFSYTGREGLLAGYNTSGNTKVNGDEIVAGEHTPGRAAIFLGHTGGRGWDISSGTDGHLSFADRGDYSTAINVTQMAITSVAVKIATATFGAGASQSSFTYTGALVMAAQSSVTLSGSAGNIVAGASVTASGFFGDGSALTGIAGETNTYASSKTFTSSVSISSTAFIGIEVSTQAAGAAGASVTALCRTARTFATGGGCSCSGGVALTGVVNTPNCSDAGCQATGWTCQEPGGTGGACSAYVICSRAQ